MDRTERLLDLVALLLDARQPISWAELREAFPEDYGKGAREASERKFERDKADLLELGIPISYVQGEDDRTDGYAVDRNAYYLPKVDLTPEELAVLYAAGSAALASGAFPGHHELAHALRKIAFFSEREEVEGREFPSPAVRMEIDGGAQGGNLSEKLEQLWSASAAHKFVQISYFSPHSAQLTQRRVDPYGLAMRRGIWSLVGFCHLRQEIRTFHVHRIRELRPNAARPRTPAFEVPPQFRLGDYVPAYAWEVRAHPPSRVRMLLQGELSPLASRLFPTAEVSPGQGGAEVTIRATYVDGLLRYALSLGQDCIPLEPPEVVARHQALAQKIRALHEDPEAASSEARP